MDIRTFFQSNGRIIPRKRHSQNCENGSERKRSVYATRSRARQSSSNGDSPNRKSKRRPVLLVISDDSEHGEPMASSTSVLTTMNSTLQTSLESRHRQDFPDNREEMVNASLNSEELETVKIDDREDETGKIVDAVQKLFSGNMDDGSGPMTLNQRTELFYIDHDLIPLFIEENCFRVSPADVNNEIDHLDRISRATDLLSWGDIVDRQIRTDQNWALLSHKAIFSTVLTTELMKGQFPDKVIFPSWLGKAQKYNRFQRSLQQLHLHTLFRASANPATWITDYAPALRSRLTLPMLEPKARIGVAVDSVMKVLDEYALTLGDREAILEITNWPDQRENTTKVPKRMERSLAIRYAKQSRKLPYAVAEVEKSMKRWKRAQKRNKRNSRNSSDSESELEYEIEEDSSNSSNDEEEENDHDD